MCGFYDRDDVQKQIREHLRPALGGNYPKRLLILQGPAGIGKKAILENLPLQILDLKYRVTPVIDVKPLLNDPGKLHGAFDTCASRALTHSGDLADHAQALVDALIDAQQPLLVRLDNLESMAYDRTRNRDVRNLLLLKLLQNPAAQLPVVFICAARHIARENIGVDYLMHVSFQTARKQILVESFPNHTFEEQLGLSTEDADLVYKYAQGNARLSIWLAKNVDRLRSPTQRQDALRDAIREYMQRHHLEPEAIQALHEIVCSTKNHFGPEHFKDRMLAIPQPLQDLMRSSFVDYDVAGRYYFTCSPLDRLLMEVDHV